MSIQRLVNLMAAILAMTLVLFAAPSQAQYPDKPIKLVVGFPPGGGGDNYGRLIAKYLGESLDSTVIVDNKPGAGGTIAANLVAHSAPDGYTLLLSMSGNMALAQVLRSKTLPYDVVKSFDPIGMAIEAPYGLFVSSKSKFRTVQGLFAYAKTHSVSFASTGTGGAAHIAMEMVLKQAGLKMLHVPYRGSGPAITDLVGGQVDVFFATAPPVMSQVKGGMIRLLAVTGDKRNPDAPDVPTFKELGINVGITQWYGLSAPTGTPPEAIHMLSTHLSKILALPAMKKFISQDGAVISDLPEKKFGDYIATDIASYRDGVPPDLLKSIQ